MMMTAIYHMLKKGEPYNATLYKTADEVLASKDFTIQPAVSILQREGYTVTKVPIAT